VNPPQTADNQFVTTMSATDEGRPRKRRLSGAARVWLLTAVLAAASAALFGKVVTNLAPIEGQIHVPWSLFAIAFLITEAFVVHVHFRKEAHTFSMTELALVLGFFMVTPSQLVVAHLIGAVAALAVVRRQRLIKLAFNLSLFTLSTGLAVTTFSTLAGGAAMGDPRSWVAALVAVTLAGLVGVLLVTVVISLAEGESKLHELPMLSVIAVITSLANGGLALVAVELLRLNPSAVVLLLIPVAAIVVAFRAYTSQHARHERLEFLYDSMRTTQSAQDFDTAVKEVLRAARRMLRAEYAELVLLPGSDSERAVRSSISATKESMMLTTELTPAERAAMAIVASNEGAVILPKRRPPGELDAVLDARGLEDGMFCALKGDTRMIGMLLVGARAGDVSTFLPEDGRLLDTFARHASVLLENDRLEETLTQLRELQDELRHQAYHDSLTGLPNRAQLADSLARMLDATSGQGVALLFLDLDDFKTVNDTLGHGVGDELLVQVANRIRNSIRPGDIPTRLGGDEFGVLIAGVDVDGAREVADRLVEALRAPFAIAGREIFVRGSVGIAVAEPGSSAEELIRNADVAMYSAKGTGKGNHAVYTGEMHERVALRMELSAALDRALERSDMSLRYQPIVQLSDGCTVAFETLLRWRHPKHGFVPPEAFLPLAAENGVLLPITRWVLRSACAEARRWDSVRPTETGEGVGVTVNLSPADLQNPRFVDEVHSALDATGLRPTRLTLEITETAAMADLGSALRTMRDLRSLGIRLALDDFGTGHSSLENLGEFPVDVLKIAKTFVDRLAGEPADTMFVDAILRLGHSLGMLVVAEGVEMERQSTLLASAGCDFAQGYWFARPLLPEAVREYLRSEATSAAGLGAGLLTVPTPLARLQVSQGR
jgi:diguanylate cyclase (GGDEF)-like protein